MPERKRTFSSALIKSVAEIQANTELMAAKIEQQTADVRAEITRITGKADAQIISAIEEEKSQGFQLLVNAAGGEKAFNLLRFSEQLNPDLKIQVIHAGNGTLWTDLDKAGLSDLGGAKILNRK